MSWQALLNPDIRAFLNKHADADPKTLALKKWPDDKWPKALILDQIKARQKAAKKIPNWLNQHPDLILPPSDIIEQASSTATARYKASLASGKTFTDLTGGAGIDSWAFIHNFNHADIVEQTVEAAEILKHNFALTHPNTATIHTQTAETYAQIMQPADCLYIDPERRTTQRRGIYKLEECSPNVIDLLPILETKAQTIIIKTSPMLDIAKGIEALKHVTDIHVIEWNNECKELLFILKPGHTTKHPKIHAVRLNDDGTPEHKISSLDSEITASEYADPQTYLYEPSPAVQKSGLFDSLTNAYPIQKLAPSTNLFTSETPIKDFPGRSFKIINTYPPQKKALPFKKANLTVRNFPETTENLRKKLGLKDGGNEYLFACTLANDTKRIIHTQKM